MKRLLRYILPTALGVVGLATVALPAGAGTNGQEINGKNGHSQNFLCLSGYNQNGYYQSNACTWLSGTGAGNENHLADGYWWKSYNGYDVVLDSYYNYPNTPIYMGSLPCSVPTSWSGGNWYTCQAY